MSHSVFIRISLMTNDVEQHLFVFLLVIYQSSSEKCLFTCSAHFHSVIFVFVRVCKLALKVFFSSFVIYTVIAVFVLDLILRILYLFSFMKDSFYKGSIVF